MKKTTKITGIIHYLSRQHDANHISFGNHEWEF
jgi:hypothetical protein